jgi:hypothetical protein
MDPGQPATQITIIIIIIIIIIISVRKTEIKAHNIHASSWIWFHDLGVWAGEDSSYLRLLNHCDRQFSITYSNYKTQTAKQRQLQLLATSSVKIRKGELPRTAEQT